MCTFFYSSPLLLSGCFMFEIKYGNLKAHKKVLFGWRATPKMQLLIR